MHGVWGMLRGGGRVSRHGLLDTVKKHMANGRLKHATGKPSANRGRKRHINIWHINNFSVTPVTDPPGQVPESSRPGYPDENVYVPWVPHTAHKLLTPGHRSGDPPPPGRETPPPPGQSPENFVYVSVPFPFPEQRPGEASTLIFKIRTCIARTDLKNKAFSADV